jgi:phosphoribosylglycinamide formyltransferase 1
MTLEIKRPTIALMASGNGSNVENLLAYAQKNNITITLVITDNPTAFVIERCRKFAIPCEIVDYNKMTTKDFPTKKIAHEQTILKILKGHKIQWILLAGYMRILSDDFIKAFYDEGLKSNRIINIHPSLLPAFPGKDSLKMAFDANCSFSGVTIHFVDAGIDTGPIIMQRSYPRYKNDDFESFKTRGQKIEHEIYPIVLHSLIHNPKLLKEGIE